MEIDIAARDPVINLGESRFALEKILTGFQRWLGAHNMPEAESEFAMNDPSFF